MCPHNLNKMPPSTYYYRTIDPETHLSRRKLKTMKLFGLLPFVYLAACGSAHTIFQKVSVNGVDQGQLKGVRAPYSDFPIENVNDSQFSCNKDIQLKDNTVINIPAGARVGAWWGHVIGGPQGPNDPDHPIAASHKGPIIVYL